MYEFITRHFGMIKTLKFSKFKILKEVANQVLVHILNKQISTQLNW